MYCLASAEPNTSVLSPLSFSCSCPVAWGEDSSPSCSSSNLQHECQGCLALGIRGWLESVPGDAAPWHYPGRRIWWCRIEKKCREKRRGERQEEEERCLLTSVNIWSKYKIDFAIYPHMNPLPDVACLVFICQIQQMLSGWNLAILPEFQ